MYGNLFHICRYIRQDCRSFVRASHAEVAFSRSFKIKIRLTIRVHRKKTRDMHVGFLGHDVVKIIEKLSDDVVSVDLTITNTVDPNAPSNLNKNNLLDLIEEVELMLNGSDTDHQSYSSNSRIQAAVTTTSCHK
ncbi:unnamed protein product [Didymodactylos carnosus]|uniref:Uncharacterized protein n=2 Tax=Didymodactylos carnosus TaxID=1234261 RepID=A0A814JD12_9BILA|nr:unnamed protein product [Didymodactylos carnosus]CAF3808185.1 unnamed protein product [Didymodactylos carnosus]